MDKQEYRCAFCGRPVEQSKKGGRPKAAHFECGKASSLFAQFQAMMDRVHFADDEHGQRARVVMRGELFGLCNRGLQKANVNKIDAYSTAEFLCRPQQKKKS